MRKNSLNYLINALALLAFSCMVSTGLLLKFIIPPGRESSSKYWLDIHRHDWGDIHAYLGLGFLILVVTHLILHWGWIKAMTWGTRDNPKSLAQRTGVFGTVAIILVIILLPWVIS